MIRVFDKEDSFNRQDVIDGGAFLVDKDLNWTSFDVVNKLRWRLKNSLEVKKFKVGHAGTLDPLATGLLIICVGKATKKIHLLQNMGKQYSGTFFMGATTPTYDSESEVDQTYDISHIDKSLLEKALPDFIGEIDQVPPIYSALKKDGVALYKRARAGEKVEINARKVIIHSFEIDNVTLPEVNFNVSCSKGTYIRSLAYDYGKALNAGAYLKALRRTRIGEYDVSRAMKVEEVVDKIREQLSCA